MDLSNERVLIVGGTGSLGQALIGRLRASNTVIVFSRDELKQWSIRNELKDDSVKFVVGDMRDRQRLEETMLTTNPSVVVIAAALKQVDTCEMAPGESIKTNVLGVQNLVEVTERNLTRLRDLKTIVMVSTDKACEPTNVYGMSKAIAERIVTSRSYLHEAVRFVAVRYGNVLESRGSIIPLFRHQVDNAPALTLTHPDMTRFAMTLSESIDLILTAATRGRSGETWIPRLRSMRIQDLAALFSNLSGKPVKEIGMRPGEKLHEMLISRPESFRAREEEGFYVLDSALTPMSADIEPFEYSSSQDVLTPESLAAYLTDVGVIDMKMNEFVGTRLDDIRQD